MAQRHSCAPCVCRATPASPQQAHARQGGAQGEVEADARGPRVRGSGRMRSSSGHMQRRVSCACRTEVVVDGWQPPRLLPTLRARRASLKQVSVFDVTFCEGPTLAKRYILQLASFKAHQREARAGAGRTRTSLRAMSVPHTRATGTRMLSATLPHSISAQRLCRFCRIRAASAENVTAEFERPSQPSHVVGTPSSSYATATRSALHGTRGLPSCPWRSALHGTRVPPLVLRPSRPSRGSRSP
jgi:hypothetical protein